MLELNVLRNDVILKNSGLKALRESKIMKIFATEYNLVLKLK